MERSLQLDGYQRLLSSDLTGGTVKLPGGEGLHPPCAEQYLHTTSTTSSTATALLGRAICGYYLRRIMRRAIYTLSLEKLGGWATADNNNTASPLHQRCTPSLAARLVRISHEY